MSNSSLIELYNSIVFCLNYLNWLLYYAYNTDNFDKIRKEYDLIFYKIRNIIKRYTESNKLSRMSIFKRSLSNALFVKTTKIRYNRKKVLQKRYFVDFYFEANFPYIFLETPRRKLFLIFDEEEEKVYIDLFRYESMLSGFGVLLRSLKKALNILYGITHVTERLQGDLFMIKLPIDDEHYYKIIFNLYDEYFKYSNILTTFNLPYPTFYLFHKLLVMDNRFFEKYDYAFKLFLIRERAYFEYFNTMLEYTRVLQIVGLDDTPPNKIRDKISVWGDTLYKQYLEALHDLTTYTINNIDKYSINITLRRGNGNPHVIKIDKGLPIPLPIARVLSVYLDIYENVKLQIPEHLHYAIVLVPPDTTIVVQHPEHGTVKKKIKQWAILIFYLPSSTVNF